MATILDPVLYIASTLSNFRRVRLLREKFKASGIGLTYDWTEHNGGQPLVTDPAEKAKVAEQEAIGVLKSRVVLVVMPGGGGTHFEMSLAFCHRIPIVVLCDDHTLHRPSFHYLDNIVRCDSETEAIKAVLSHLDVSPPGAEHQIDRLLLAAKGHCRD